MPSGPDNQGGRREQERAHREFVAGGEVVVGRRDSTLVFLIPRSHTDRGYIDILVVGAERRRRNGFLSRVAGPRFGDMNPRTGQRTVG